MKALIAEARHRQRLTAKHLPDPSEPTLVSRLADALEAAQDWKAQAMTVLSEWEATYEAAGSPGRLGQSKAVALREEIERLRALSAHPAPKPRARVVPRPFDSDCAIGICAHKCSHLMWACDSCSCEGGWGAPQEKLAQMAAEHVCAALSAHPAEETEELLAYKPITADELGSYLTGARPGDQELSVLVPVHVVARAVAALREVQVEETEWEYGVHDARYDSVDECGDKPVTRASFQPPLASDETVVRRRKAGPWSPVPTDREGQA